MSEVPDIVLTADKQQLVKDTLRRLQSLQPQLEKLRQCGIDCSGYQQLKDELQSRFTALAKHFVNHITEP